MEVLTLDGKKYVKASKVARDLGYASDYVGQLCRSGAVDAHLVGRSWYVNPDTVGAHRVEKKRNARVKAREHAKRSIEQAKSIKVHESANTYKNIDIRYEKDKSVLMPDVRKVPILSQVQPIEVTEESTEGYTIENENKKIVMSGTVAIIDADADEQYTDTTVLTPKLMKRRSPRAADQLAVIEDELREEESEYKELSFKDRIALQSADTPIDAQTTEADIAPQKPRTYSLLITIICIGVLVSSTTTLFVAKEVIFESGVVTNFYTLDTDTILNTLGKI